MDAPEESGAFFLAAGLDKFCQLVYKNEDRSLKKRPSGAHDG